MVSVIDPEKVEIWIADAGTDPFDTGNGTRSEVLGVSSIEISGAKKDVDQKVTFASSVSDRFHLVKKPATISEITLESAVFNMDDYSTYFSSTSSMAERTTDNLALGIKLTREDSSVDKFTYDPAYITSVEIKATTDETVTATITLKASPAKSKYASA